MTSADSGLDFAAKASATSGADLWHTTAVPGVAPSLRLSDGPHGLRRQPEDGDPLGIGESLPATCFPPAVALSCTWNPDLARRIGVALATEARAFGVHVLLGPGLNIKRSPLCGRNFEYFSEDPLLTGILGAAMVSGIQSQGVAATPKHFAVNNQETDRMRVNARVSGRALREIYLAAFERVVKEAAPWALMTSYNRVNGPFASEHRWLLTELLRDEWGFDGLVMSDWGAINDRVAAVHAGCDLEMPPSDTDGVVIAAVEDGSLAVGDLDLVSARLAVLARRVATPGGRPLLDEQAHDDLATEAAAESVVLLENRNSILPLAPDGGQRIAVIGEFAVTPRFQGGGSSTVVPTRVHEPLEELTRLAGPTDTVAFAAGYSTTEDVDLSDEAVELLGASDVAIVFLGLPLAWESEGFDRVHLDLPTGQLALLDRLCGLGKPVVVVLCNGGVVRVTPWREQVDALLEGWLLGQAGGRAVAELIFGLRVPSGRLSETIPLRLEDTPAFLNFPGRDREVVYAEDVFVGYRHYETVGNEVAYPFGYGLSYTTFDYIDLTVEAAGTHAFRAQVTVRNSGARAAHETVQLYVGVSEEQPTRPRLELRGFTKVFLEPGERTRVTLDLTARDFSRWSDRAQGWQVQAGDYSIAVGRSVRDLLLSQTVTLPGDVPPEPLTLDSTLNEWMENPVGLRVFTPFLDGARAAMGQRADYLLEIGKHVPIRKFASFRMGITLEQLSAFVEATASENPHGREL